MNRTDFQPLADVRIAESKILLDQGRYDGAYYLAGYAVECGLKACIAKLTQAEDWPNKEVVRECFTHVIEKLVKLARLQQERDNDVQAAPVLGGNWAVVKDWSEESRYHRKTEAEARRLYDAITDATHGVLPWIKSRW